MSKHLLIVESPAKAKTIEKYLGKDFTVKSSYGHIRDLAKDSKEQKAIDVDNNYKLHYEVSPEKWRAVKDLKEQIKKVDDVWLATDEDREGEAIAWHLAEVLGLNVKTTKRIVFREITKPALQKAVQNPRTIDMDLVNAQQARRALDRLVGFELSGLLWKKIKAGLSAGRVQSVAVRLVVEREREIKNFEASPFFKVVALFSVANAQGKITTMKAVLSETYPTEGEAKAFLEKCLPASYTVLNIVVKPAYRKPAAPFTTSTLQQEASRKLGFSVSRTMSVAQGLYESGLITYMRTDSTNLSEEAVQNIANTVVQNYGQNYLQTRQYKNKVANAQEAHEAIRPTYMDKNQAGDTRDEQRLYELIWKRTIASQMADAQLERTTVDIGISTIQHAKLVAEGEVIKFDGFLKVYLEDSDDEPAETSAENEGENGILPPLKIGQVLNLKEMTATQRFTRPVARFTEASLVKKLEELGIGRPSTYASIISKIMEDSRGYVVKENRDGVQRPYQILTLNPAQKTIATATKQETVGAEKQKLFATDLGMVVTDFLASYFDQVVNYKFTANIEHKLDEVSEGKADWVKIIDNIYKPFHQLILATAEEAQRATGERVLGKHPTSNLTVLVRVGRYGAVAQIGTSEELADGQKPQYANLKQGQSIEKITLEEALQLFELPKSLGQYKNQDVILGTGRYGLYVKYGETYVNLPKNTDPQTVEYERVVELIDEKLAADAPIGYYQNKPITKGAGRFGPFVKWNDLFVSILKGSGFALETITEAQAIQIIEAKLEKEANRYIQQWAEHDLAIENGRWGAFIRSGKENYKLVKDGAKLTPEQAQTITLAEVIAIVEAAGGKVKQPKAEKEKKTPTKRKTTKS